MRRIWLSRLLVAIEVVKAKAAGRRWFIEWTGSQWEVVRD